MARRIRIWKQGASYHATLVCIDRMFLLKPSAQVNDIVGASLGRALVRHPVQLHSATTNINHMELVFSLGPGQVENASPFLRLFEGLMARELNRFYEREGHFWSCRARVEEILTDSKAEALLGYGACNVVKDGLVESARDWTGFSTTEALSSGGKLVFEYINRTRWWKLGAGHREVNPSEYTRQVKIELTPLPGWESLSEEVQQSRFRNIVQDREELARQERQAEGILTIKGMEQIDNEEPFAKPHNKRIRSPQPWCHADTMAQYEAYKADYQEIVKAHRIASAAYRNGTHDVEFPIGTFRPPLVAVCQAKAA